MKKFILILCVIIALLPASMLPHTTQAATLSVGSAPGRIINEFKMVNVTGAARHLLNGPALGNIKRELASEGWQPTGKAFYSGGK